MGFVGNETVERERDGKWRPDLVLKCLLPLDLHSASEDEIGAGRALAVDLISPHVATAETFTEVHRKSQASIFVYRRNGRIIGTLGIVPLQPRGLAAIRDHRFDARNPARELVCAPGDAFAGLYGWGFAALTKKAAVAVIVGSMRLRETVFADIPCFTRAATPAGERIICGKMGYRPYPGSRTGLLVSPVGTATAGIAA